MARRREPEPYPEEEYYEDEYYEDEYYEEEMLDEAEMGDPQQKLLIIMTSSWGISFVVHVILIVILMFIYLAQREEQEPPTVIARPPQVEQPFDEKKPRSMHRTPKIESPKQTEKPIKDITPEKTESEKPKGTSLNNMSSKNLESTATVDAYGGGGGRAGAYGSRFGSGKWRGGGSPGTESAVQAALRWLKRHQSSDGRWKSRHYDGECSRSPKCKNKYQASSKDAGSQDFQIGRGMDGYDVGVTGLALLAFLGNGHTHKFGRFKRNVRKGIEWLKKVQVNDPSSEWHGSIGYLVGGEKVHHPEWIYNHAIATMALCEAYSITKDFALKDFAQRAVDFAIKCQNPGLGWRYDDQNPAKAVKPGRNDTSVTGWMVLALKSAKAAGPPEENGLNVPKDTFRGAITWFTKVTSSNGQAGYMTPGGGSSVLRGRQGLYDEVPCMTAVSVLCRIFAGQEPTQQGIRKGVDILMNSVPKWDPNNYRTVNLYYWYYGTYAMFQAGDKRWDCGKSYNSPDKLKNKGCSCWNHAMQQSLLLTQRQGVSGDCADGSWDPIGEWGIAGGRVYSTAIGALTLEIYYRYERLNK